MGENHIYKGVQGVGINIPETQHCLFASDGTRLPFQGVWHLEFSRERHAYLTRIGQGVHLVFRELKQFGDASSVYLSRRQGADMVFGLPELLCTARRAEIVKVRNVFCFLFIWKKQLVYVY